MDAGRSPHLPVVTSGGEHGANYRLIERRTARTSRALGFVSKSESDAEETTNVGEAKW
jgi:hypothetical protein